MKFVNLIMTLALVTAVTTVGCGGSDEEQKPGGPGVVSAGAVLPPTGGYNYCQAGTVWNGATCVSNIGPVQCQAGTVYNTQYGQCLPTNYNCPLQNGQMNSTGCSGTGNYGSNYTTGGWQCNSVQYNQWTGLYYYSCQYVQYMPHGCVQTYYGPYCY